MNQKTAIPSPFANLKQDLKKIRQEQVKAAPVSAPILKESFAATQPTLKGKGESRALSDEENHHLFLNAVGGVKVLKQDVVPQGVKAAKSPDPIMLAKRMAAEGHEQTSIESISDQKAVLKPVASEAVLSYKVPTLQNRVFDQLKLGKLRWYQAVDLHGCTVEEAREAVLAIVAAAEAEGQTVLKIVHGKGQNAMLKTFVNGWLRQHSKVLGFHSAPEAQGGTGSVLVLIKKGAKNGAS